MPPITDRILWLDLETTGSAGTSEILEVGVAITDSSLDLKVLDSAKIILKPSSLDVLDNMAKPQPTLMHSLNGLTAWIKLLYEDLPSVSEVDDELNAFLDRNGISTNHIPLAGSGVSHFDRQFIRRDFPKFDKRLTYWAYDIGVVRRFLALSNIEVAVPDDGIVKTHRALDDVFAHIEEARTYMREMTRWHSSANGLLNPASRPIV